MKDIIGSCVKEKNIGIELLRIVSMFMIVVLHCFNIGGILGNVEKFSINYYLSNFIFLAVYVAVNLYALTTGYLCIYSRHRYSRIINLWIEVFFYSVSLALIFFILPGYNVSKGDMFFSFFPLLSDRYWYFTAYFLLFLMIPFINKAILNLTKKQMKLVLLSLFLLCSVGTFLGSAIGYYSLDVYFVNDGLSFLWLFIVYIFGAYIRIYGINNFYKNYYNIIFYFICTAASLVAFVLKDILSKHFEFFSNFVILSYSFPFIFLASIFLFIYFINLNFSNFKVKKFISVIAGVTFSVYLISTHFTVLMLIEKDIFINLANADFGTLLFSVIIFSLIEFTLCIIIGLIVKLIFKILKINELSEKILRFIKFILRKIIHI